MEQEHAETYAQFKSIREDSQQLWKIKFYVDSALEFVLGICLVIMPRAINR